MSIDEFNISVGANLRLRYAGTTTGLAAPGGGIIIRSTDVPNSGVTAHAGPTNWSCSFPQRGHILDAEIVAVRFSSTGVDRIFRGWDGTTIQTSFGGSGVDLWGLFTHELGHALGLGHSTQAVLLDSTGAAYSADQRAIMNAGSSINLRHWTKYEKDTFRTLYGTNAGALSLIQSGPNRGWGTSWKLVPNNYPTADIVSGIGKMSESAQTTFWGWSDRTTNVLHGRSRTNNSVYTSFTGAPTSKMFMPPAMTYSSPPIISRGKNAHASTELCCSFPADNATDGDLGTQWKSDFYDPQWIMIDLGAISTISRVRLHWDFTQYAVAYEVQVSNDNSNWTSIASVSNGDGGVDDFSVTASARYVRMYGTSRAMQGLGSYSLVEFDIYGAGEYRAYWVEKDPDIVLQPGVTASYYTGFMDKRILWMKSSDGVNWSQQGALVNPSTGQDIKIYTDSVTAGYDPYRRVFIVLWIDNAYNGRIMTMPAPGSSQAGNVYSALSSTYWEAPSVSCLNPEEGQGIGCMIVGIQHSVASALWVLNGTVTASGSWSTSLAQQYGTILLAQTPSVWRTWSGSFLLGWLARSGDVYWIYRKALNDTAWTTSAGVSWPGYYISPPVLGGAYSSGWQHAVAATVLYGP